jgi:cardiolipin synthase A/B
MKPWKFMAIVSSMKTLKSRFTSLPLVLSLFVFAFAGASAYADELIVTPLDKHQTIIKAIGLAKKTVDIVNFHLSDRDVVGALTNASKKGIQIRMILDSGILSRNNTSQKIVADLKQANIQVKPSTSKFSITHQKSLVIDDEIAFVTTMNLVTTSAVTRDFGIVTEDQGIIAEMDAVFTADWANADANDSQTPALSNPRLLWSPVNSSQKLVDLIHSATSTIDLDVESFGDHDVLNALAERASQGVKVRTITPGCISGDQPLRNRTYLTTLATSGVVNRVMPAVSDETHPYMHAKILIVDQKVFYVGSENFSFNSLTKARELGIITEDNRLTQQVESVFNQDWGNAVAPDQVTQDQCDKVNAAGKALSGASSK